ncbi:glycoside hydrolase domain-containing protein [Microlunatus speluncae]|uniref:glycoside hydrolase domain-containing protein n=1 Tax=Microlunatus speluncae TaxID=2594267 RepID=UPI00126616C8|nr:glycoside hydrolase domain-containing protein [Microlunatus speluncae]
MKLLPLFAALVATLCVAALLSVPTPAESAARPQLWAARASTHVFPDSLPGDTGGQQTLALDSARNEFEAGQVMIRWDREFTIARVAFTPLKSGRNTIPAAELSYNFVKYVSLNRNSRLGSQSIYAPSRPAPGEFPEGLSNAPSIKVAAERTQPIWVRVKVPKTQAGGIYRGTVKIETDHGTMTMPLSINVRPVTIPDTKDSGFTDVEWTLFFGTVSHQPPPSGVETMLANYGFSPFSPEWWKLMEDYADLRRDYRNNNLTLPMNTLLLAGDTKIDSDGTVHFDWSKIDQVVEFFMDRGTVSRLEGFWVNGGPTSGTTWGVETLARGPEGNVIKKYVPWDSPESSRWINDYVTALRDHVKAKGWDDIWWMHIGDEPQGAPGRDGWNGIFDKVKAVWPEVVIGDATAHEPVASEVSERVDIAIPNLQNYESHPRAYDEARKQGKDLWFYNCNIPGADMLNRFVDQPQYYQRLIGWLAAARNANGHLHWAFNNWNISMDDQNLKGDFWVVNPDKERKDLLERTIRLESMRDGIEDWEVITILKRRHPQLAMDLAKALASTPGTFTPDVTYLERIRALALDAAAGKRVAAAELASVIKTGKAVDLGSQQQLDGVFVTWGDTPPAGGYIVETSYDGEHWVNAGRRIKTDGGEDFVGLNAKGRYVRLKDPAAGLIGFKVAGSPLSRPNLAGGLTYQKSWEPPSGFPDTTGRESTDGVVSDTFGDQRPYVIQGKAGEQKSFDVTFDLGAEKRVREVIMQGYAEYAGYRPDTVRVLTSTDGKTWTDRGGVSRPNDASGNRYQVRFAPVQAQHVKIAFTRTFIPSADGVFIDELEVY